MSENPRTTQFLGFAKLLFDDIEPMFNNRFIELDNGEKQEAEKTKQSILECFAECAYDLACHCFEQMNPIAPQACSTTEEMLEGIPDLTEWPKENTNG